MKKGKSGIEDGMRRNYRRSDFPAGLQKGRYARQLATRSNIARLKPEIAAAFPTDEAVNAALAAVLRKQRAGRNTSRMAGRGRDK